MGCQPGKMSYQQSPHPSPHTDHPQDDQQESAPNTEEGNPLGGSIDVDPSCIHATSQQWAQVNLGLTKIDQFLALCYAQTGSQKWCDQVARPNPERSATFYCTYSILQPHNFIHPDESTWPYAIAAIKLVQDLVIKGIGVDMIYNWWRPEPYNKNVGGAAGRHPYGTAVDVRFSNKTEQNRAHALLCQWRAQGKLRALGYYDGTGLHLGVGDATANTWGKNCP